MDHRKNNSIDSWDDGVYGTGNTMPPKSHSGIIALLVILVIFLSGIISLLSFMNIRLFQQLSQQTQQMQEMSPMSFKDLDIQEPDFRTEPTEIRDSLNNSEDISLSLNQSPQSVDNIPEQGALSWQEIYEKNNPSVVSVLTTNDSGTITGSGVVLSDKGYIVTTCRMVHDAETINITLSDGRSYSALVVGADHLTDLAVLYVEAEGLVSAEFGDSDALRVGDSVVAMSGQLGGTLHDGILSAIYRDMLYLGKNITLIQSSAAISDDASGGPLINCYGQIIGLHTNRLLGLDAAEGSHFVIPSTTVKFIVDQLIAQGYVSGRPTLGLTGEQITRFDQYYFHIPQGLYLTDISPDSDAHAQGITPGDILISLDGEAITNQIQLDTLVNSRNIGDSFTALVYHNGQEMTFTLTVTEYEG
ncbi:MAG: serine protease [Ruminococcaceae bacterium]|nr:serine protease [Oscillospiraceae bacterium]